MEGILFSVYWIIALGLDIFLIWQLGRLLYPHKSDFYEALRYVFTPDLISLFRGEYMQDRIAEFKIGLIPLLGVVLIYLEIAVSKLLFTL